MGAPIPRRRSPECPPGSMTTAGAGDGATLMAHRNAARGVPDPRSLTPRPPRPPPPPRASPLRSQNKALPARGRRSSLVIVSPIWKVLEGVQRQLRAPLHFEAVTGPIPFRHHHLRKRSSCPPSTCWSWTVRTCGENRSRCARRRSRAYCGRAAPGCSSISISHTPATSSFSTPARWAWRASCRSGWARATPPAAGRRPS
jgi:hypothetical protein